MKQFQTVFMALMLFFISGCAGKVAVSESPRGLFAGDKMPVLEGFFKPLPGQVISCNGRVIVVRVYPFHQTAAISFSLHKHKEPYGVLWFTGVYFTDENGDGVIDEVKEGFLPPDAKCLEKKTWQNKPPPPGLEGVF